MARQAMLNFTIDILRTMGYFFVPTVSSNKLVQLPYGASERSRTSRTLLLRQIPIPIRLHLHSENESALNFIPLSTFSATHRTPRGGS